MMATSSRWVGSSISAPTEHGTSSPIGRQRHYAVLELAGSGEQVNVNDVIEIDPGDSGQHHRPRLVQVLCMWEDTFTGACKFRARYLVHASDLPKDALARLHDARRAFADETSAGSSGADATLLERNKKTQATEEDGGPDVDEVFLTADMQDLDVVRIVKPVTLSVGMPTTERPAEWKGKLGPRLTHSFDASSGDFTPVERTDAIAKRARVRNAEAVARVSRHAEESAAATSGKPVTQSSGWLMPRRRAKSATVAEMKAGEPGRSTAATSVGDSASEGSLSDSSEPAEKALKPDDMEWEKGEEESDGDSDSDSSDPTDAKCHLPSGGANQPPLPARTSSRLKKSRTREGGRGIDQTRGEESPSSSSSPLAIRAVTPAREDSPLVLRDTTVKHQEPLRKRPRRLEMPPMKEKPRAVPAVATRQSKRRPSIAGERKRGRPARARMEGAEDCGSPPRRTLVGDDYQVDIPDLLPAQDRKRAAAVLPAPGTGAKMVWRSIRNWDPQSRGMLSAYFDAAKEVMQMKQARPGVAVHVRLGGNDTGGDDIRNRRDREANGNGLAKSYAVWAVTTGSSPGGVVRVACSEMAQTEIPMSAIQRVQSEEEALAALVKSRCTLDAFEPALEILDQEPPESIEPWTLSQVRTLEQALEKDYDPDRRLHGWAREGMSMDRDDFIDLAHVSKQVPGKTSAQVLSFYYRYLAAAEPLTDVVYGTEAAKSRKLEAILPATCGTKLSTGADSANLSPAAKLAKAGWRAFLPACRDGKVGRDNPPIKPDRPISPVASRQPPASMAKRPRSESREDNLAKHAISPQKRGNVVLAPAAAAAPGSRRPSVIGADAYRAPSNEEACSNYERRQVVIRGRNVPRDVPVDAGMFEANDLGNGANDFGRDSGAMRRSFYSDAPGPAAARSSNSGTDSRDLLPRPRLVGALDTAPAPRGYRTEPAVPSRVGRSPPRHSISHDPIPFRHEHVGDDGRDHGHVVNSGGGVGGGYSRHGGRHDVRPDAGVENDDELGFMAPCWRLLEMAKSYLEQDQLLYMRGLIVTHVRKPMTRHQLLERADSCLQDQQEVLAAFAKMFDRVDHARAEAQLVPLYQVVKRARAAQAESVSRMAQQERRPPPMAVRTDPRSHASYSSYSQSPAMSRTYEAPLVGRAVGGGHGRDGVFASATSDSYSREAAAAAAVAAADARHQRAAASDRGSGSGWWRDGDSGRTAPYTRGATGPPPASYSAAAPPRSAMVFREDRRDSDYDVQGEVMRAWPQHQHQHQHQHQRGAGQWRRGDGASSFSAAAVPADVRAHRPRVPWGNGR